MSDFYARLPAVDSFGGLCDSAAYRPLPDDWRIAVADVAGSTAAIAAGRYKAVNTVGVSVIAALTNALKPVDLPYVFGGDGAVVCVPGGRDDAVRAALSARRAAGELKYGMHVSDAAIMTCLVKRRQHEHVHFVDAAGGGYAAAAKRMKAT